MKNTRYLFLMLLIALFGMSAKAQQRNVLQVPDVTTQTGDVQLPVSIENTDEIVGAQFDLVLPDGVIAQPVGTLTNRSDGHTVTVSQLSSGAYRVLLHSGANRPLLGQSGVVMYLPINIPDSFEEGSEHQLTISNAILGKATGENVLTEALAGKLIISKLPDLLVKNISVDHQTLMPGDRIVCSWQVENVGRVATNGGWSEQLSLVSTDGTQSKLIATTHYDDILEVGGIVSRQAEVTLPFLLGIDGQMKLQVRILPDGFTRESASAQANYTQESANTIWVEKLLSLELSPKRIDENSSQQIALRVNRTGRWSDEETFTIATTTDSRVNVPTTITIPANQSGTVVYFSVTDNDVLDDDTPVTITVNGNDYPEASTTFIIDDNETPSLSVTASTTDISEGETFQLTISTNRKAATPVAVTLTCENARRFDFPSQVSIPAGESSVTVDITAIDNDEIELEESIAFRASADRHERGECIIIVGDNDMPTLTFTLTPEAVSEADGNAALFGVIKRTDNLDKRVTLKLSDDSDGMLTYPSKTIVMEKNQTEVQFNIGVTNNDLVDGMHVVDVTAAVYVASCDCSVSGENKGSMTNTVTILDDDGPTLKIKPAGTSMLEGSEGNVFAISHNIQSDADITVHISSDKDDMLEYDHELTIPAGQSTVNLLINVKRNDIQDDSSIAAFTVEANGFAMGTCWILITDQTLPDATVSLTSDKSEAEAQGTVLLRAVVKNVGNASLRSTTPLEISFSGKSEIVKLTIGKTVDAGDSAVIEYNYDLPAITGNHTFEATVNAAGKVPELIYANNTSGKVGISIISPYRLTAQADKDIYQQDDSIHISGVATGNVGKNANVEVYFINEGARQTISTTTDEEGHYTVGWKPLSKQSGHFIVGACYPGTKETEEMDAFDVYGIKSNNIFQTCELNQTDSHTGKIILINPGNLAQTGLTVTPKAESNNCVFTYDVPASIGAGESVEIAYTVTGNETSEGWDWQQMPLEITTAEGSHLNYTIYYYVHSLKAKLHTNQSYINTTMSFGTPREYPVTIKNIGRTETGKITLALPNWIQTVTPSEMASLAQGDSATILLRFIPTEEMKLNVSVTGNIGVNCVNGDGLSISFNLTPVSESLGKLKVDVVDEFTFFTTEAPHVSNAKVQVKNPSTNEVVAEGVTADDGTFTAEIPEGYYSVTVEADKHDGYTNTVIVDPGVEKCEEVFLTYQAITYSWDVEETTVEDEYEIETIVKYETRVPKPVVIITLPDEQPEPNSIIPVIVTNKGLINAVDVNLSLSIDNGYSLEFMNDPMLEVLAPQQSHVFYAKLIPEADDEGANAKARRANSNSPKCFTLIARAKYKELCQKYTGEELAEKIKKWGTRHCLTSGSGGGFTIISGGGGGGYGPGSITGFSGNTTYGDDFLIWDTDDPAKFCDKVLKETQDENTPISTEAPEETNCGEPPVLVFVVGDLSGKYSRKGLAADGESKVKIILDGSSSKFPKEECTEFTPIGWHLKSDDGGTLEEGSSWEEAIYTAPEGFSNSWGASKEVIAVFTYMYEGIEHTCEKSFALIRVPVVFVHGLNSDPGMWKKMIEYLINSNKYSKMQLSAVDYENSHNDRYSINYPKVMRHLTSTMQYFKKHYGYEVSKLDVVGHSMGGLLTKKSIQEDSSIGVRKLITINTPHGGSQLGNFLLDPDVQYVRDLPIVGINDIPFSPILKLIPDQYKHEGARRALNAVYSLYQPNDKNFENGAVANLSVNCDAINDINYGNTSNAKCHAIICNSNNKINYSLFWGKAHPEVSVAFGYMFSAFGYTSTDKAFEELFNHDDSDAIVPFESQKGGLSIPAYSPFEGKGELSHISSCDNADVQNRVLELLLASPKSSVFSDGFKATPSITFDMPQLEKIYSIYPRSKSARTIGDNNMTNETEFTNNNTDYQLIYKYIKDDNILEVSINKNGLVDVEISAYIDKELIFIENTTVARIHLPNKYVGQVGIICDASDEDGNSLMASDVVDIDGRGDAVITSIQFNEDEYVILNDLSVSPTVLCNWSDGTTSYASNIEINANDSGICSISDDGVLSGHKTGVTLITAKYGDYECTAPVAVYIYNKEDNSDDSPSICSTVTLSFKQKAVMTRQAFRGTLTVNNGNESTAMRDVKMNLEVRDKNGNLTTSHEFQIDAESLKGFEGNLDFTSGWTLAGGESGVATILFIPTKYAAPTEPQDYSFGGSFSYTDPFTGLVVTRDLNPVTLTVNPSPNLEMTYFMQRDVFGDDPLTEAVEPMIPSEFALIVNNIGYGPAENMSMTTQQPEIIDNQKGLAITFELISTQLNGGDKNLALGGSMTSDFGTIPAHSQAYAQWWLQSSLLGHFLEYDVKATHITSRNNPDLSLLDTVTIHELIHGFMVSTEGDEPLRGFLVNDIKDNEDIPDVVYFTDGTQQSAYIASGANMVKKSNTEYSLNVNASSAGWTYGSLLDPTNGKQKLVKVTRSNGVEVNPDNIWQTDRTLRDGKDPLYENRLHFVCNMVTDYETFNLTFEPKPDVELEVESFVGIPDEGTALKEQLTDATLKFNKPVKAETFTTEDITLTCQGVAQDASMIVIEQLSETEFKLKLNEVTLHDGYYVLTIQTTGIVDNEGYNGSTGKQATWVQFVDGTVVLTVSASPVDGGTVTPESGRYEYNNDVTLNATPAAGYVFSNWTRNGEIVSTEPEFITQLISDMEMTAHFSKVSYYVEIESNGEGGSVSGASTGIYEYGTQLTVKAEPFEDYMLKEWTVNGMPVDAGDGTLSLIVEDNQVVLAIFEREYYRQEMVLYRGWNWLSSYLNEPIDLAMANDNINRIVGQFDELIRDPQYGLVGGLESLSAGSAYKIETTSAFTETFRGHLYDIDAKPLQLHKGWNWIAFPYFEDLSINTAVANAEEGDYMVSQRGFSEYAEGLWEGTLSTLSPGDGYLYKSASDKILSFDFTSNGIAGPAMARTIVDNEGNMEAVDIHLYPNTMNMTIQVFKDEIGLLTEGLYIYAFAGDELRGTSQQIGNNHYLTVYGDEPVDISFVVESALTNEKFAGAETLEFHDDVVGSRNSPFILHINNPMGIYSLFNDNCPMTVYNLEGILIRRDATLTTLNKLPKGVYIVNGHKCYIK